MEGGGNGVEHVFDSPEEVRIPDARSAATVPKVTDNERECDFIIKAC